MATIWPTPSQAARRVEPRLPDGVFELRDPRRAQAILSRVNDDAISAWCQRPDTVCYEMGDGEGLYYISNILCGVRADINILVFPRSIRFLGDNGVAVDRSMIDYGFRVYDFLRLQAFINVDNQRSWRRVARVGFKREGRLKDFGIIGGVLKDSYVYGLTRKDFYG